MITKTIPLGPDLLLGTVLNQRGNAFATPAPTTSIPGVNWWISLTKNGPAVDDSLTAEGTVSGAGYIGTIYGSALVAHLSDYLWRSVFVITAVGAQIIACDEAIVVLPGA